MNPKKLYVRETQKGISVGEYVHGKWYNVDCIPKNSTDVSELSGLINDYKKLPRYAAQLERISK